MRYDLYVDSYRRYKAGTNAVARWLVKAGRLCGLDSDVSAWKTPTGKKYLMPLGRFIELAEAIVHAPDRKIIVTAELLANLEEVIGLRKAASTFYQDHASANPILERSNEGHVYAIQVLEAVFELLRPLQSSPGPRKDQTGHAATDTSAAASNIFGILEVEELADPVLVQGQSESRLSASQSQSQPVSSSGITDDVLEVGSDVEDVYFILFCFFKDIHGVRVHLQKIWRDYKAGKLPLISASITTDLAFDVVRRQEAEMLDMEFAFAGTKATTFREATADLYKSHMQTGTTLYCQLNEGTQFNHGYLGDLLFSNIASGGNVKIGSEGKVEECIEEQIYEAADWMCIPAYIMLDNVEAVANGARPNGDGHLKNLAKWTLRTPRLDAQMRFGDDLGDIIQITHQMRLLRAKGWDRGLPSDVWSKAILEWVDPEKPSQKQRLGPLKNRQARNMMPVWLAWATTVQLDINRLLAENQERAFADLGTAGDDAVRTIDSYLAWSECNSTQGWKLETVDSSLRKMRAFVLEYLHADPIADTERILAPRHPPSSPRFMWRRNQVWCGVLVLWLKLSLWGAGIYVTTLASTVFHMMHLYNMSVYTSLAHQDDPRPVLEPGEQQDPRHWADMEYLIKLHKAEHLFYGGRPINAIDCSKRAELCMGMSIQRSAPNRRGKQGASARGRETAERQIHEDAIGTSLFNHRYDCMRADESSNNLGPLQLLIAMYRKTSSDAAVISNAHTTYLIPLLDTTAHAVARDALHLDFDCVADAEADMSMHLRCADLMQKLQVGLMDDLAFASRVFKCNYRTSDPQTLRLIPGHIMMAMRAIAETPNHNLETKRLAAIGPRTDAIIQQFAAEEGSVGSDEMTAKTTKASQRHVPSADADTEGEHSTNSTARHFDVEDLSHFTKALSLTRENDSAKGPEATEAAQRADATHRGELMGDIDVMGDVLLDGFKEMERKGIKSRPAFEYLTSKFNSEQLRAFLATDDIPEMAKVLRSALDTEVATAKKKRNNRNKNRNRKLRQQGQRERSSSPEPTDTEPLTTGGNGRSLADVMMETLAQDEEYQRRDSLGSGIRPPVLHDRANMSRNRLLMGPNGQAVRLPAGMSLDDIPADPSELFNTLPRAF